MMAWIFQPENSESSPCSQDTGVSPWPADSPDSGPGRSATSRTTNTPSGSCSNGSKMTRPASIPLPSGTTSRPSIPDPGEGTLTSSRPGSLASLTLKPAPVGSPKDLTMIGTSGPRRGRSFGWWDASGSCLRTYQASFNLEMEDGNPTGSVFSEIFPNWGSVTSDGEFIAQPTPGRRTSGKDGGSWPTPIPNPRNERESLEEWEGRREREKALGRNGNGFGMPLDVAVRHFPDPRVFHIPTPTTADVYTGNMESSQQSDGSMHSVNLPDYVEMFPTPSTMDHIERKGMRPSRAATNRKTGYLSEMIGNLLPTPTSVSSGPDYARREREGSGGDDLVTVMGGSLNPDWVEQHLMSLPEGWTRLEPVPDGAYQEWFDAMRDGTWWDTERGLPRVATGVENRVNRLKILGNGIVPASGALAVRDMMSWCWGTIDAGVTQEEAKRRGK